MESKELTIVIVTFKSEDKIFTCLNSIPTETPVYVVENSNNNIFKNDVESRYPNVECILTGENKGYAAANNIGLNKVKSKFALVLNPDATLDKNAIKNFLSIKNKIDDFWLIGPAINQSINNYSDVNDITQVQDIKGFAIFFNIKNLIIIFLMIIFFYILKKLIYVNLLSKKVEKFI